MMSICGTRDDSHPGQERAGQSGMAQDFITTLRTVQFKTDELFISGVFHFISWIMVTETTRSKTAGNGGLLHTQRIQKMTEDLKVK